MSIIVPSAGEVAQLQKILNQNLSLRLYSNNYTPIEASTTGAFTQVVGGGYIAKTLVFGGWSFTTGDPSFGLYTTQEFTFTGPTDAPGTVYGYYVVDTNGVTLWAERFNESVLPFSPVIGSLISITPRYEAS